MYRTIITEVNFTSIHHTVGIQLYLYIHKLLCTKVGLLDTLSHQSSGIYIFLWYGNFWKTAAIIFVLWQCLIKDEATPTTNDPLHQQQNCRGKLQSKTSLLAFIGMLTFSTFTPTMVGWGQALVMHGAILLDLLYVKYLHLPLSYIHMCTCQQLKGQLTTFCEMQIIDWFQIWSVP